MDTISYNYTVVKPSSCVRNLIGFAVSASLLRIRDTKKKGKKEKKKSH